MPCELVHIDFKFWNVVSIRGFTCSICIICAKTRFPWIFHATDKSPPISILRHFSGVLKRAGIVWRLVRTDEGSELVRSDDFLAFCEDKKIIVQTTGEYASQ